MLLTEIQLILRELCAKRPIFHSEADFQHALAWCIREKCPTAEVRLEVPSTYQSQARAFIDLVVKDATSTVFFELKYKTASTSIQIGSEVFNLKSQGAQDQGSYDFLKDISRIESFVAGEPGARGYAVMLCNDPRYWTLRKKVDSIDRDFQLVEGRVLSGRLAWAPNAGIGSKRGREQDINLGGAYQIKWLPYSHDGQAGISPFKFLILEVLATDSAGARRSINLPSAS